MKATEAPGEHRHYLPFEQSEAAVFKRVESVALRCSPCRRVLSEPAGAAVWGGITWERSGGWREVLPTTAKARAFLAQARRIRAGYRMRYGDADCTMCEVETPPASSCQCSDLTVARSWSLPRDDSTASATAIDSSQAGLSVVMGWPAPCDIARPSV